MEARNHPQLSRRQQAIFDLAREHGSVNVDDLADRYDVTVQTIRRDLNSLYQARLLQRIHGGAIIWDSVENLGYGARKLIAVEGKQRIGRAAAELIPNDCSLFINIGTTTEQLARHLVNHTGLLVVTNNVNVVNTVLDSPGIEVMMAGGLVRRADGGVVGEATVDFIRQFRVDYAVIGASAIEQDGTILDFDIREVRVSQAMIASARSVILLADSNKFERKAPVRIAALEEIDYFVTDDDPPPAFSRLAKTYGVHAAVCRH